MFGRTDDTFDLALSAQSVKQVLSGEDVTRLEIGRALRRTRGFWKWGGVVYCLLLAAGPLLAVFQVLGVAVAAGVGAPAAGAARY